MTTRTMPRTLIPIRPRFGPGDPGYISPEEYLRRELEAEFKSEYEDGRIIPWNGEGYDDQKNKGISTDPIHNGIVWDLSTQIATTLREEDYWEYGSNQRICVSPTVYYYPDISVVYGEPKEDSFDNLLNPIFVAEVMSYDTHNWCLGDKFHQYRHKATVQEYLFVSEDFVRITLHTRLSENSWLLTEYVHPDDVIHLSSIGANVSVRKVYRRVLKKLEVN